MATQKSSPAPVNGDTAVKVWEPPDSDQDWDVTTIADAPGWIDKNWASFDRGPAIAVPAGNLDFSGPYHTKMARVGDKILFLAAKGAMPAHFEVVKGEIDPDDRENFARKPPQVSAVSLEDALRTGSLEVKDLGAQGKAQVLERSPGFKRMIEDEKGLPEPQAPNELVKLD